MGPARESWTPGQARGDEGEWGVNFPDYRTGRVYRLFLIVDMA